MPYGVDKKLGGDSKDNVKWMEKCVSRVMEGGKDKSSAVAICKAQLRKNKSKNSEAEFQEIDPEILQAFNIYREKYIRGVMGGLDIDYNTANGMFLYHLAKKNYDIYQI